MKSRGFTLIELLVVIAVIGILASVILVSLNSARGKARNAIRIANLHEIQTALESYYSDNGSYPANPNTDPGFWRSECPYWTNTTAGYPADQVIPGLVPTYMPSFPSDPSMDKSGTGQSCYLYHSDGRDYVLIDHNIVDTGFSYASFPQLVDPARDGGTDCAAIDGTAVWAWKVYSPGGVCW
jgi:prepilin-type N-terminal cleavage/methylation domain-containing protein